MWEKLLNYGVVFAGSMIKFVLGPVAGTARNLSITETAIFTALGMSTTVFLVSLMSDEFRYKMVWHFRRDKRLFTPRNRRIVKLWGRVGVRGIAFLTPVFFMPAGGALIAFSFGGSRQRIMKYMFASAFFWAFAYSIIMHQLGNVVSKGFSNLYAQGTSWIKTS